MEKKQVKRKKTDIDRIVDDLAAVDASFKKDEQVLRTIIAKMIEEKPHVAVNASFKKRLREQLAASQKQDKSKSIIHNIFEKRWLLSAAAVVLVIVISAPVIKNMVSAKKSAIFFSAQEEKPAAAPSRAVPQRADNDAQKKVASAGMTEDTRSQRDNEAVSKAKKQETAVEVHEEKKKLRAAEAPQDDNLEKKSAKDDAPRISKEKKAIVSDSSVRDEAEKAAATGIMLPHTASAPAAGAAAAPARLMENDFAATKGNPYAAFFIEFKNAAAYYGGSSEGTSESASAVEDIRKMVDAGSLPPKQAVRIERIINSFSYDYPEDTPFSLTVEYAVCPWNSAHTLVHVGIRSSDLGAISRVQMDFNPAFIASHRIIGANRIPAGTRGTTITALYETVPAGLPGPGDSVVTVRAHYLSGGSKMVSQHILGKALAVSEASMNMRFAAAAAEFGLLISDSQFKGNARYENVIDRVSKARSYDVQGERLGFIRLVESAARLQK